MGSECDTDIMVKKKIPISRIRFVSFKTCHYRRKGACSCPFSRVSEGAALKLVLSYLSILFIYVGIIISYHFQ